MQYYLKIVTNIWKHQSQHMVYFLLAESKLSCMNVRNSDKRTQTTTNVVTMRINCGEHLPKLLGCSSLESDLTTSPALSLLQGGGEKGRGFRRGKERKRNVQRLNINVIKSNHHYAGWLSLSKGILKAIFIPTRLYVSQLRQLSVWIFIIILNIKQKNKHWGRNSRKEMTPITYFPPPGFGCRYRISSTQAVASFHSHKWDPFFKHA